MVEQFLAGLGHQYYEDPLDTDASRFRECGDILSNHSICQHISGPTHMDGHTLDLIITKLTDNLVFLFLTL